MKSVRMVLVLVFLGSLLAAAPQGEITWLGGQTLTQRHLAPPRDPAVVQGSQPVAPGGGVSAAQFARESSTWPSAAARARALAYEQSAAAGLPDGPIPKVGVRILGAAVEFSPETVTYRRLDGSTCLNTAQAFDGPARGRIPKPVAFDPKNPAQPYDNNSLWYTPAQVRSPAFYANLLFGYRGAGRIRTDLRDPRDGRKGINLRGVTVQSYYDGAAGKGNVLLSGKVYGWLKLAHAEAYYGADGCGGIDGGSLDSGGQPVAVEQLVADAAAQLAARYPKFRWRDYDRDGDQVIDFFWVFHAGAGQEAGGGAQDSFALWSQSGDARSNPLHPRGIQVSGMQTPADYADDFYIGSYSILPEDASVGVMAEELGHAAFGLPDLYLSQPADAQSSLGFWSAFEAGTWGGYLAGSQPVGMTLWLRMIADCGGQACNWQQPLYSRYVSDPAEMVMLGQLESTPGLAYRGVRIILPPVVEQLDNPLGTAGKAAFSGAGWEQAHVWISRPLDVPPTPGATLNFITRWDLQDCAPVLCDYGQVEISTDGGQTWAALPDLDGYLKVESAGPLLTGSSGGVVKLRFDLGGHLNQQVMLRFSLHTDDALDSPGWFVDDVKVDERLVCDFDTTCLLNTDWILSEPGWVTVPYVRRTPQYYLVEWRSNTLYDGMARTAYVTIQHTRDALTGGELWQVQRIPYNLPGALITYRDTRWGAGGSLRRSLAAAPSYGPKYQLLAVDVNPMPLVLNQGAGLYQYLNPRASSYDAALTLQEAPALTLNTVAGAAGGPFNLAARPAVTTFDDRQGYTAGLFAATADTPAPCPADALCAWDRDGSAVLPAAGPYSLRLTDYRGAPITARAGEPFGPSWLGTGNPGDDGVALGAAVKLLTASLDGRYALLRFGYTGE